MTLTLWDPFRTLSRLDREFDQVVRRAWGTGQAGFVPATDITTDGDDVRIALELPGLDASDVDIEVGPGRLTISGSREESKESERSEGKVLIREQRYGAFRREFALPEGVTADQVEATYDRGLLEVRVKGVTKPAVETRKIPVRGSLESTQVEPGTTE